MNRTTLVAAATSTAAASAVALLTRTDEEDTGSHHQDTHQSWLLTAITSCEGAFLSNPFPRLRRHSTVEQLEKTATKSSLESSYNVDWNNPLGEGSFGKVYSAVDKKTGERVAVKKISKTFTDDRAFQREMDALLLLRESGGHPNICGMRANYDEGEYYYIVMDFVGGREMFEQLCCNGPYSEADAARHVREAASALAFLHGMGIIHTDIKPENLLLSSKETSDAVIKLVDLGCAHFVGVIPDHQQRQKGTANTPAYCPPEVIKESRDNGNGHVSIAPSFDMWSLGIVIYIMLVGAHPYDMFATATDAEIEHKIVSGEKPPLRNSKYAKHLSEDAMELIEGLMEIDPEQRLTAEQVLENPWVRGETASCVEIANSDKRLASYRKYKTRIGSTFFKMLLSQTDAIHRSKTTERVPLLESAFRRLDSDGSGFLSTSALQADDGDDSKLTLSDVSSLLADNMKNKYFPKGHVVYNEGSKGDSIFIINSGKVELTSKEGFEKTRESGEIFGEDAVMSSDEAHSSTVKCLTPVHVIEISKELFEKYVASDQETFLSMAETDRHRRRERASTMLRLNKKCRTRSYRNGDVIFREGEKGSNLFLVEKGNVDISVHGHKVRSLQQGEMTGEHAAYFDKPYNVTAKCVSDSCKMQALPSKVMHKLFKADPSLRQDFRELMLRRDFKKALCAAIGTTFPTTEEEIRAAFEVVDKDKSEAISFDELSEIVLKFDPTYNETDIRDMLDSLDLNHSKSLTWDEFHRIFSMDKES